jgi:hypothetical protein
MFFIYQTIKVKVKKTYSIKHIIKIKISLVDWIVANMLAVRQGSLGHLRYVLKNDLKWIPLYGFYFEQVKNHE